MGAPVMAIEHVAHTSTAQLLPSHIPENAPEACPGTESEQAGHASSCAGCPNQDACQTAPKGPDPDLPAVQSRMAKVKRKILVLSGKGGVGKSTVSAMLASAFARDGETQVGAMDIDICGPSLPLIFGVPPNTRLHSTSAGILPMPVSDNLGLVSIGFMLPSSSSAVIWRGPKKNSLIKKFLRDVDWGDEGLDFLRKTGIRVLGVVENMAGFVCPSCGGQSDIFVPSTGGAEQLAKEMQGIEVLGSVPLDPRIGKACD